MGYQLLLLGLLAEQPRHGYEIKQHFEEGTFAEYVKVSGGGLYYNLHKLVKEGYVAEHVVEREGNYPERQVYEITEDGRKQLYSLVGDTLSDLKARQFFDPIDAALLFSNLLPKEYVIIRLQRHIDRVRGKLLEIELVYAGLCSIHGKVVNEPYTLLLLDHSIARLKMDFNWLISAQEKVKNDPAFEQVHRDKQGVTNLTRTDYSENGGPTAEDQKTYMEFDARNQKTLARYNQQLDQAWREYEVSEKLFGSSREQLQVAQNEYDRKVQNAWEKYHSAHETLRVEMEEFIKKALPEMTGKI